MIYQKTCQECLVEYPKTIDVFNGAMPSISSLRSMCKKCRKSYFSRLKNEEKANFKSKGRKIDPQVSKAHKIANIAQSEGRLVCPTSCEQCGRIGLLHKHHPDYAKPLTVVFLCPKCHTGVHRGTVQLKGAST